MTTKDTTRQFYEWGLYDGREGLGKSRNKGFSDDLLRSYNEGYERGARIWEHERRKRTPA